MMKLETLVEMIKKTAKTSHSKRYKRIDVKKRYKPDQKLAEEDDEKEVEVGSKKTKFNKIELYPTINSLNQAR